MHRTRLLPSLLLAFVAGAYAEPVQLYVMEVPPMTLKSPTRNGVVGEIVVEAMKRAGMSPQFRFPPNNRAIVTVQLPTSHNTLIIPLARVPEREEHFTWIAPLYKVDRAFFTTKVRIETFAMGRTVLRSVAVSRGTAGTVILRAEGYSPEQIYEINENDNVPRMLVAGRMDAWFGPLEQMRLLLQDVPQRQQVIEGAPLGSTDNYLACSKQCDPALVARLSAQLAKMEKDGTIKAIRARYASVKP